MYFESTVLVNKILIEANLLFCVVLFECIISFSSFEYRYDNFTSRCKITNLFDENPPNPFFFSFALFQQVITKKQEKKN